MLPAASQSHRLRLLVGIELTSKVIQRMIKTLWESPGINAPAQVDDSSRWRSQTQLHEDRDDTVRAGDGSPRAKRPLKVHMNKTGGGKQPTVSSNTRAKPDQQMPEMWICIPRNKDKLCCKVSAVRLQELSLNSQGGLCPGALHNHIPVAGP